MFSRFFIERPIFACVLSILIFLAGAVSLFVLPVNLYPEITPPQITVTASYPGASAKTIADSVAAPLEDVVNGVEGMLYMTSTSASSGNMSLSVVFDIGTNVDQARINVQNLVNVAITRLPEEVRRGGITVGKSMPSFIMVAAVESPNGKYDPIFTSNFASLNIAEELKRVKGVGRVEVIGARDYSMRIWLKPDQMSQVNLTVDDIVSAIRQQNTEYPIGWIGAPPTTDYVDITVPVNTRGRLTEVSEYEDIIIRSNKNGGVLRLKDVAKIELGAQSYNVVSKLNKVPTTLIAIYQEFDSNALNVANRVKKSLNQLSKTFPVGIEYSIPYDATKFVRTSIKEVFITVIEAAILVSIVVFLFLQNWRVAVIPMLAMIVSIVGTFAGMYILDYSINTLTLFGLVLAIGIVVDDAIVVVENIERNMREGRLVAKEAAYKAMSEVTGPVIAIVFVLCAVFVPVAFLGGIAGQLYRQFALTITISVIISGFVALTLSPALAALLLTHEHHESTFSKKFHSGFNRFSSFYLKGPAWFINNILVSVIIFLVILGGIYLLYRHVPQSLVPSEDQGYFISSAILSDEASLQRTMTVTDKYVEITLQNPAVDSVFTMTGFSLLEGGQRTNQGTYFPVLKDWNLRKGKNQDIKSVMHDLGEQYQQLPAKIVSMNPPSIRGLGAFGGFQAWVVNRSSGGIQALELATQDLVKAASKRKELAHLNSTIKADSLQLTIDLDRAKAIAYDVQISSVFDTLVALLGSLYVNDFNKFGKVFRVILEAQPKSRQKISDIEQIFVRSTKGEMVPLSALVTTRFTHAPMMINHFNGYMGAEVTGSAAPGYSSGQAMKALEEVAQSVLPPGMGIAWSGEAYQEKMAGGASMFVLFAGIVVVFFILSALYENWLLPIAILLAVPFGIFGAFIAIWARGIDNDIYFQIGLVALIALTAKNSILIVEFANHRKEEGWNVKKAALEAARLRLRAIIMTSLTFIVGVLPLVFSSGAGSASRHSVGTGVMGGMITSTILGLLFVPFFYFLFYGQKSEEE